jgi:hypothetical protein
MTFFNYVVIQRDIIKNVKCEGDGLFLEWIHEDLAVVHQHSCAYGQVLPNV